MKFIKKYKIEILSIIIPILILLLASLFNSTFPFGKWTLAKYDGFTQYPGFTSYYREVLLGNQSIFYSFKGGLGYNFFGIFAYYMSNLSNLLCIFFNNANVYTYYTIIIYLRVALASFTMCKYLKYKFKDNNIYTLLFSIAYSLIGFNVCYFFNYMYYDTVVLFPLVILGLEKLIYEDKKLMYIITLTLSIISNFYIGYMVCIFCLLYFIYSYILLDNKNSKIIKKFILSSLLSGLMCMFLIIPTIFDLINGKGYLFENEYQTDYLNFNLNFINIFYKATPGSFVINDIKFGSVNIYFTLFAMIFVIKFFFNNKISKKEKITTLSFILFFLLCISFNLLDYAWQMFQRPIWYPNRYIFTFSFFLLMIAYKSCKYKKDIDMKWYTRLIVFILYILIIIYPFLMADSNYPLLKIISLILSIILLFQYIFFGDNKNAIVIMVCLFILEITINTIFTIKNLANSGEPNIYYYVNLDNTEAINKIKSIEDKENNFYRVEFPKDISDNTGSLYLYNGINMFSSLRNGKIMLLFNDYIDYDTPNLANITYSYKNPYLNSIFGIKYMADLSKDSYYENIGTYGLNLFKNNEALSLGFMVNSDIYNYNFINKNHYENTKEIVNKMLGSDNEIYNLFDSYYYYNTLVSYNEKRKSDTFKKIDNNSDAYILFEGTASENLLLVFNKYLNFYVTPSGMINDRDISNYFNNCDSPILINKGDKYSFKFKYTFEFSTSILDVYAYSYEDYINFINEMKNNEFKMTKYEKDNYIEGYINATSDKSTMFTTIPYDKGWNVYVDNKKVKYNSCFDAFICLDLDSGEHKITFKFIPRGLIMGTIISIISFVITIIYVKKY